MARTNELEWRILEDRDEKTGSSCIKIPQLGHRDNNVQSPHLKEQKIENAKDGAQSKMGRN
jgi:hypothetical protein